MTFELDASLKRLGADYIDIYYMHRDDLETPLEETVSTLGDFIHAGKVRYLGLSNFDGWRIAEFVNTCRRLGVPQPIVLQPVYNAMNRSGEVEMFAACAYYGMGIVPYSPLARGVLTGKYQPGGKPASRQAIHAPDAATGACWRPSFARHRLNTRSVSRLMPKSAA